MSTLIHLILASIVTSQDERHMRGGAWCEARGAWIGVSKSENEELLH